VTRNRPTANGGRRNSGDRIAGAWEFPGWGTAERIDDLGAEPVVVTRLDSGPEYNLGEWKSTAICGNDITSSCLYVVALCAVYAGPYAPVALAAVAGVLYLFRSIYSEVCSALPLNGGAYNALLNTTTKAKASVAACLTLLSYLATAVISANEAMHYAHVVWPGMSVVWATVVLLGAFATLSLMGISESATVALGLFLVHMGTLTILVVSAAWTVAGNPLNLAANWHVPPPGGILPAIFFGFSAGMLGISGFESSANFIEEQRPGVFPKTLRNMWIAVAVFNPLISLLAMGLLPLSEITGHMENLLAQMGLISAGPWLQQLVSVDAVLVLSGAVLTAYVGVTGLVRRMSLDRCLPQFLLAENRWRRTNHWIILIFFALCCSILFISSGRVEMLAGVYTLSFLGVMALFAVGNMLLKVKRARLPRAVRASWPGVVAALVAVCAALAGNLVLNPRYVRVFAAYFLVAVAIVGVMFLRVQIMKVALAMLRGIVERIERINRRLNIGLIRGIRRINSFQVVYFSRGDNLAALNRAVLYVLQNELTSRLKVVHCYEREEDIPEALPEHLKTVDRMYPNLRIDLVMVKGRFGPELIEKLSRRMRVPKNYMFIGTPGDQFPHNIAELGGVRLVL
jgi:amino acid transporter